jgi:hypothetical protein
MAIYVYSEQQIERRVANSRRFRIWFCVAAILILVMMGALAFYRPDFPNIHQPMRGRLSAILLAIFLGPLLDNIWRWRSWPDRLRNSLRKFSVEIASGIVSFSGPSGEKRQLGTSEIIRLEEPSLGGGLYLRTSSRYRYFLVPRKLDGYDAIKRELAATGAPLVKTFVPPNREELLFVLLFLGTIICAFCTDNIRLLKVNLFVAMLVSLGGLLFINNNADAMGRPQLRLMRFGALIPVAVAAFGLWLALQG